MLSQSPAHSVFVTNFSHQGVPMLFSISSYCRVFYLYPLSLPYITLKEVDILAPLYLLHRRDLRFDFSQILIKDNEKIGARTEPCSTPTRIRMKVSLPLI